MWFLSEDSKSLINSEMVSRFFIAYDKYGIDDGLYSVRAQISHVDFVMKSGMTEDGAEEYLRGVWIDLDNYPR